MSLTVLNPATEDVIAELEPAGVDEMNAAVGRAGPHALDAYSEVENVFSATG